MQVAKAVIDTGAKLFEQAARHHQATIEAIARAAPCGVFVAPGLAPVGFRPGVGQVREYHHGQRGGPRARGESNAAARSTVYPSMVLGFPPPGSFGPAAVVDPPFAQHQSFSEPFVMQQQPGGGGGMQQQQQQPRLPELLPRGDCLRKKFDYYLDTTRRLVAVVNYTVPYTKAGLTKELTYLCAPSPEDSAPTTCPQKPHDLPSETPLPAPRPTPLARPSRSSSFKLLLREMDSRLVTAGGDSIHRREEVVKGVLSELKASGKKTLSAFVGAHYAVEKRRQQQPKPSAAERAVNGVFGT